MTYSLPFEFNNTSISSWLTQLNSSDAISAGQQLFKVLEVLKREINDIESSSLSLAVKRLTPVVGYITGFLEKKFYDKGESLSSQQRKIAQMSILLVRHQAFLHIYLMTADTKQADSSLHANYGSQFIGLAFYYSALSSDKIPSSLWGMLGEVYKFAHDGSVLEQVINKPLPFFEKLPSIAAVLKRNILFEISNHYDFSHKEIKQYFDFCTSHWQLLEFDRISAKNHQGFCWEYASRQAPFPITEKTNNQSPSLLDIVASGEAVRPKLFFNLEPLFEGIKYSKIDSPLDESKMLVEHLSNYLDIKESVYTLPELYVYLFGLEQVVEFMARFEGAARFQITFDCPSVDKLNFSSLNLTAENTNKKKNIEEEIGDIWGVKKAKVNAIELNYGAEKAFKTKFPRFLSAEWMKVKVVFGGLVLMYGKNMDISIAIIRRLDDAESNSNIQKGIIEVIEGRVSIVNLLEDPNKQQALLISKNKSFEIILSSKGRYVLGAVLKLKQGEVVLNRLLESTPLFIRYEVGVNFL